MSGRSFKDIVQSIAWHSINRTCNDGIIKSLVKEAYAALGTVEMAALQAENIVLREALSEIIAVPVGYHVAAKMESIARAALKKTEAPTLAVIGDQGGTAT